VLVAPGFRETLALATGTLSIRLPFDLPVKGLTLRGPTPQGPTPHST
jgi:hypothetical protein